MSDSFHFSCAASHIILSGQAELTAVMARPYASFAFILTPEGKYLVIVQSSDVCLLNGQRLILLKLLDGRESSIYHRPFVVQKKTLREIFVWYNAQLT